MATDPRIYLVLGYLVKETEKAMLIEVDTVENNPIDPPKREWFPKSQIVDTKINVDSNPQEKDRFNIKHWILNEKGMV